MSDDWTSGFDPEFLKAAADCALANNATSTSTLTAYFGRRLRYVDRDAYKSLSKSLRRDSPSPRAVVIGEDVSLAPTPVHFVYLDVGCWTGDGGDDGWTRHREFGVVHGGLALLCGFARPGRPIEGSFSALSPPKWADFAVSPRSSPMLEAAVTKHPQWEPVAKLLGELARDLRDSVGDLYLLGATMVASALVPTPPGEANDPITVFIGDFHAPVATAPGNTHIVENGREMLRGRLETLETRPDRSLYDPRQFWDKATNVKRQLTDASQELRWDQVTTHASVENWLSIYHTDLTRSADIFQGAGKDLARFVDVLKRFHNEASPLRVVQLGDMFDLWLGFQRAFSSSLRFLVPRAKDFAKLWVERTLYSAGQGAHLRRLLTMSEDAGLNIQTGLRLQTEFLYGNHDNYRRHRVPRADDFAMGEQHANVVSRMFGAPSKLAMTGLWAEHGHQPDPSNHDEDPTRGYALTQAAFLHPGIRTYEGPATWALWKANQGNIARVTAIMHAMQRCLLDHVDSGQPCRGIYVMGHTHEAMLKRVELMPWAPPTKAKN